MLTEDELKARLSNMKSIILSDQHDTKQALRYLCDDVLDLIEDHPLSIRHFVPKGKRFYMDISDPIGSEYCIEFSSDEGPMVSVRRDGDEFFTLSHHICISEDVSNE